MNFFILWVAATRLCFFLRLPDSRHKAAEIVYVVLLGTSFYVAPIVVIIGLALAVAGFVWPSHRKRPALLGFIANLILLLMLVEGWAYLNSNMPHHLIGKSGL